jgi:polyribonucleotide nucleotidyltransferase
LLEATTSREQKSANMLPNHYKSDPVDKIREVIGSGGKVINKTLMNPEKN